ncbi:alpha/beta hydrolase [Haloferax sp. Atlit-47N]|uniref:Alpha/beta hydrolase family protein n=1 Tax=Haloferax sp. Atlit-48N TaxID=2077198 RepID=A0ACD5HSB9_9EURY|nr:MULTISPECIES: alpha/beta hydrolase family protein [Haloferax]RDZ32217.1 alpha/beta hydrolase [Haloferax sp. Atlit-48N]RDZ40408.1 alpha/beta hydrolase [Haloferax sp. Atlit-47N]WEL25950.1 Alpha/beta superfamily hydrolase [Haloferax lucentense]
MDHLETPAVHRLLTSPAGRLLTSRPFEAFKTRSLPREFGVVRARAAADVALSEGPEAFLREVGAPPAPHLHDRIERALARYARLRGAYDETMDRWERVFWGDGESTPDERVAVERERREVSERRAKPTDIFGFLSKEHLVPPVKFETPPPEDARTRWHHELAEPERLYGFVESSAAEEFPRVERSATVRGPGTVEYLLRFRSPSPHLSDRATARVYEPVDIDANTDGDVDLPTLVFHSGWGMFDDQLTYWPEEESVARALAPEGYRVILPDAPWHGRRELLGRYSGEPYIARAPVGLFTLYSAAALETAVLIDWARTEGAPAVGVGGVSLGGTVALHVGGRCGDWPESMRPDLLFPVGMPGAIDQTLLAGGLTKLLDIDDALDAAGWTGAALHEFAPLLNPPKTPCLAPERVFSFVGSRDEMAPASTARALLDEWGVPRPNRREWDCGHFGVLAHLIRDESFRTTVRRELDAAARDRRNRESVTA